MTVIHTHDAPLALQFRFPHLYRDSSDEAICATLALKSEAIDSGPTLRRWLTDDLHVAVPFQKAVVGLGVFTLDRFRIDRWECVGFDGDYFEGYLPRNPFRRSYLIEQWIANRAPISFDLTAVDRGLFDRWHRNAERWRISNGVFAGYECTKSNAFVFMKLFNVSGELASAARRVDALAPVLKTVWQRIADAELGVPVNPRAQIALTPAQQEILALLKQHKTNAEIAAILGKSPATVKTQVQEMLRRTGCSSRHILASTDF